MSYRQELEQLVTDLREAAGATAADDFPALREKLLRQAEVVEFLVTHPTEAVAAIEAQ